MYKNILKTMKNIEKNKKKSENWIRISISPFGSEFRTQVRSCCLACMSLQKCSAQFREQSLIVRAVKLGGGRIVVVIVLVIHYSIDAKRASMLNKQTKKKWNKS